MPSVGHNGALVGPVLRERRPRRSKRLLGSFPETRRCWSTPTTRSKAFESPPRSTRPCRQSELIAAIWIGSPGRRAILDELGRPHVKIVASGDLDEYWIAELLRCGAPIDGFGIGTELITSRDAPAIPWSTSSSSSTASQSSRTARARRRFRSRSKSSGAATAQTGFAATTWTRAGESAEGQPLLVPILQAGRLVDELPSLERIRTHCREQVAASRASARSGRKS